MPSAKRLPVLSAAVYVGDELAADTLGETSRWAAGKAAIASVAQHSLTLAKCVGKLLLSMAVLADIVAVSASAGPSKRVGLLTASTAGASERQQTGYLLDLVRTVSERVQREYVDEVGERKLFENALSGLLSGLDPHSRYVNNEDWHETLLQERGEYVGLGIKITQAAGQVRVVSLIDNGPAARAGLKPGDLIRAVDGKDVTELSSAVAVDRLLGTSGSTVTLTIERQGTNGPISVTLTRTSIHIPTVTSHRYGRVGYIRLAEFNEVAEPSLRKAIAGFEQQGNSQAGVVLDLRDNPGGLLEQALAITDDFLVKGRIVSINGRSSEVRGRWNARAKAHDIIHGLPMVVLINDGSASASEIVAGALQDHRRAVLLGTRSFGKGTAQTVFPLPAHLGAVILTTSRFYTPSGRAVQGVGITPDVEISDRGTEAAPVRSEHEADLRRVLPSKRSMVEQWQRPLDPSFVAGQIALHPPGNWPSYDPTNPATDFQLQQALTLVRAMAAHKRADRAIRPRPWQIATLTSQPVSGRAVPTTLSTHPNLQNHTGRQVSAYGLQGWWSLAAPLDGDRRWR